MYSLKDYMQRGMVFMRNQAFPSHKRLSSLMIYATDLCDSACKHCLIWAKRPTTHLSKEKIFDLVSNNKCITESTTIGLEGGEFLLHPDAMEIMHWFKENHPKFDLLSNCLKPAKLIEAVKAATPQRLWISLDGDEEGYRYMRGKDGYHKVLEVIHELKSLLPISVMFTLSPYNDFNDMRHVATICKQHDIDMRIGIYNNIAFFDTLEKAHITEIGLKKNGETLTLKAVEQMKMASDNNNEPFSNIDDFTKKIPDEIKQFEENYDFLVLYNKWRQQQTNLRCFSIFDSTIILPNGDVPICQNLNLNLGNVHKHSLDTILNSAETIQQQRWHSKNCNRCWINYHRKYDIVLYKSFENYFGRWATKKLFGYYQWDEESKISYKQFFDRSSDTK